MELRRARTYALGSVGGAAKLDVPLTTCANMWKGLTLKGKIYNQVGRNTPLEALLYSGGTAIVRCANACLAPTGCVPLGAVAGVSSWVS